MALRTRQMGFECARPWRLALPRVQEHRGGTYTNYIVNQYVHGHRRPFFTNLGASLDPNATGLAARHDPWHSVAFYNYVQSFMTRRHYRRPLLATLAFAGLRVGELLALRWRDVDLATGRIHVRASKTDEGVRTVDLRPELQD